MILKASSFLSGVMRLLSGCFCTDGTFFVGKSVKPLEQRRHLIRHVAYNSSSTKSKVMMSENNMNEEELNEEDDDNDNDNDNSNDEKQHVRDRFLVEIIKRAERELKEQHNKQSTTTHSHNQQQVKQMTPQVAHVLNELIVIETERLAEDLRLFAKHANRTQINKSDVLLFCRRRENVRMLIEDSLLLMKTSKNDERLLIE
jgi:hypothetical protein